MIEDTIEKAIVSFVKSTSGAISTLVVAYSGGKDSHVLLHALSRILATSEYASTLKLKAFHVHHGLSQFADSWAQHAESVCQALNVPLDIIHVQIDVLAQESLEALARQARYDAFRQRLLSSDLLLTAHHQADQAETLLINLLRGTGLQGLCGIHFRQPLGVGVLLRPMLNVHNQAIDEYAIRHQLTWVEDDSNTNLTYTRNFIRHQVLPLLEQINPKVRQQFAQCARLSHETQTLLDDYVMADLRKVIDQQGCVLIDKLKEYAHPTQKALLRLWFKQKGHLSPSEKKLDQIQSQMLSAKADKNPMIIWGQSIIRRYRKKLYLAQNNQQRFMVPKAPIVWDLNKPLILGSEQWDALPRQGQGICQDKLKGLALTVCFRQFAERVQLPDRQHTTKLKKLLQFLAIPPWERPYVPLFYLDNSLIAIGDYWVDPKYSNSDNTIEGRLIQKSPASISGSLAENLIMSLD